MHRIVLPRVLSIHQVKQLARTSLKSRWKSLLFGSLCIMAEGRCYPPPLPDRGIPEYRQCLLSGTVCPLAGDPAGLESRLNDVLIDRWRGMRTPVTRHSAKAVTALDSKPYHALEEPTKALIPWNCCRN